MSSADQDFLELRPRMFGLAYRMLGSRADAEDVLQDAWLRWQGADRRELRSTEAWLTTVVTRLSIDKLREAKKEREHYTGTWLPEPLVGEEPETPEHASELASDISMAFLMVLERLAPEERAVFLLREVFDYSYEEIAPIVERTEANCRQIALRARKHVEARRPRFEPSPELREELAGRFFAALSDGDVDGLVAVLADDVALHGDGGGRVPALARSLHGAPRVARTLMAWVKAGRRADARLEPALVNGQPGARIVDRAGRTVSVMEVEVADGAVRAVHSVVNPDKLAHLGPLADYVEALRRRGPGR
jgi:RNA polymerase sigma-70 factor (ECF subfamily)